MTGMEASKLTREAYLKDPCGASSLPYWKTETIAVPEYLTIVRDDLYTTGKYPGTDEPYFRMIHRLKHIPACPLPAGFEFVRPTAEDLADHIAACYQSERVSAQELRAYIRHPVFDPDLRIAVRDTEQKTIVASGIAEFDRRIGEGILDWIQVSPAYRRRGLGRLIVCELLRRLESNAVFVTVSGKLRNPDNPRALYEACGFTGTVIWHVVTSRMKAGSSV